MYNNGKHCGKLLEHYELFVDSVRLGFLWFLGFFFFLVCFCLFRQTLFSLMLTETDFVYSEVLVSTCDRKSSRQYCVLYTLVGCYWCSRTSTKKTKKLLCQRNFNVFSDIRIQETVCVSILLHENVIAEILNLFDKD